jgi:predicted amidohydrolase
LSQTNVLNSAFVIENGSLSGRYSKAYPNEPGVAAGREFPIFAKSGVRYGINICNDANHADAAERVSCQDAALILYPLNNMLPRETAERWRERSKANLVARARQTSCWIASADVTGCVGDFISFGCTAIVHPDGQVVSHVPEGGRALRFMICQT